MPRRPDLSVVTAAVQEAGRSREAKPPASTGTRRRENTVPLTIHVGPNVPDPMSRHGLDEAVGMRRISNASAAARNATGVLAQPDMLKGVVDASSS